MKSIFTVSERLHAATQICQSLKPWGRTEQRDWRGYSKLKDLLMIQIASCFFCFTRFSNDAVRFVSFSLFSAISLCALDAGNRIPFFVFPDLWAMIFDSRPLLLISVSLTLLCPLPVLPTTFRCYKAPNDSSCNSNSLEILATFFSAFDLHFWLMASGF